MTDYPLGRLPNPYDARDQLHPFAAALPTTPLSALPNSRYWMAGKQKLDQGPHGYCVGFAGANFEQASPVRTLVSNQTGIDNYMACKAIDGSPNTEGTYDRALMKVLAGQGRIDRYLWAQSLDDIVAWLLTKGGILVGTNWYQGMFTPSKSGLVRPTGTVAGGHEYFVRGVNRAQGRVKCVQSWGPRWGLYGEFWMLMEDLDRLVFREGGDGCTASEKSP